MQLFWNNYILLYYYNFAIHKGIRYKIRSAICSFGELFLNGIHLFNLLISSIIPMEHFACSNINNKTGHVLDKSSLGEFLLLMYVVNITQIQHKKHKCVLIHFLCDALVHVSRKPWKHLLPITFWDNWALYLGVFWSYIFKRLVADR